MSIFAEINPAYLIAFLFFFTFCCYLVLSVITFVGNHEAKMRRDYLATGTCLALFSLFYGLMTITVNETLLRIFWAGGFISGFLFFPTWILFLLNIVTVKFKMTARIIKVAFVITVFIAVLCVLSNDAVITMTRYGNQFSYQNSVFFTVGFIFASILAVPLLIFQFRWWREAELKRHRNLALVIIIVAAMASSVGFITDFIIPIFTNTTVTPLGPVSILAPAILTYVRMMTNKTLSITVRNVSGYTFSSVMIPILVLDQKNNIGLENKAAIDFFGGSVLKKNIASTILLDQRPPEQSFFDYSFASETVTAATPSGVRICDMLLTVERDKHNDALCKVAFIRDITESKYKDSLLETVNRVSGTLLEPDINNFENDLFRAMDMLGKAVNVNRVYIWKNHVKDGKLFCTQLYEWSEGSDPQQGNEFTVDIPYDEAVPAWQTVLSQGKCINGLVREMSASEQARLTPQGIISILIVPVFLHEQFWGFVGFDDCRKERMFTENEELILRSVSRMIANALIRNDMTKQLESALEQANVASKAKNDFLSNISHEMRTPMNAIIGMTAICKGAENPAEKNYALGKIEDAATHLLGVINDVLDMSKIEANKLELVPVEYNFERMLQKVIAVVNFRAEEKHQLLTINLDNKIPGFITGDEQRLAQVITNLVANAIKFTPERGTIDLEASLIEEADGECELRIEVADSGIGISAEQQEKLFLAFEQAESGTSREYGGTGLGLVISKRIIELMNGKIWVESELGKGARFIFTVKALRGNDTMDETSKTDSVDTGCTLIAGEFKGKRLLIAEDIGINREILIALLKDTGLIIDCAENGKEALDIVAAGPEKYDIVFMDVQMPQMDGLEATRHIRALPGVQKSKLPIIAMTANVFKDDIDACLAAGMDSHLSKPLDIDKVFEKLRDYLNVS